MGINYRKDEDLCLVLVTCEGPTTGAALSASLLSWLNEEDVNRPTRYLVDARSMVVGFDGECLRSVLQDRIVARWSAHRLRIGLVVSTAIQYGTARQFQAYSAHLGEAEVFLDWSEALDWIQRDPIPAGARNLEGLAGSSPPSACEHPGA